MLIEKAVTKKLFIKPLVCFAERNSPLIQHQSESIVPGGVLPMQEESKPDFLSYFTTMSMVKEMLSQGLISISEFMRIEEDMCKKYCINITSIFRINAG